MNAASALLLMPEECITEPLKEVFEYQHEIEDSAKEINTTSAELYVLYLFSIVPDLPEYIIRTSVWAKIMCCSQYWLIKIN